MREQELMPLSAPQPSPASQPEETFSIWRDAPAWRNLTLAAIGLSTALLLLSVSKPAEAPDQAQQIAACHGNPISFSGLSGSGRVVGFLSSDQSSKLLQYTQFSSHMAINPDYLANARSLVHLDGSPEGSRSVYLVPNGVTVALGDHVQVAGGHVDPSLPCHYIPNLVTKLDAQH